MRAMNEAMFERFTPHWRNRDAAMAAYDAHYAAVRGPGEWMTGIDPWSTRLTGRSGAGYPKTRG
jgi:hypothetical protein